MLGDGNCQPECNLAVCEYDSGDCITESQPFLVYVSTTRRANETGSFSRPFSNLHQALMSVWASYTVIYLLAGLHSLELRDGATELDPLSQIPTSVKSITLASLHCSNSSDDHSECTNERAELLAPKSLITLTVTAQLIVKDLVIRGDYDMQPGCWEPLCTYCPYVVEIAAGVWQSDKGVIVEEGHFAPQSVCDAYRNFTFINTKDRATLTIQRVTFQSHRQQMLALIRTECSAVFLSEVDFIDIMPMRSNDEAAVIWQNPHSNFCGSLIYEKGTVSYINNGYEFKPNTLVSSFLRMDTCDFLSFDSVTFHHNSIMMGVEASAEPYLIHINDCRQLAIRDCRFERNLATKGSLIGFHCEGALAEVLSADNSLLYQSQVHFLMENTVFRFNYANIGNIIEIAFFSDHKNVHFRNCTFDRNSVNSGGILQFFNAYLLDEFTTGIWIQVSVNNSTAWVFFPPRLIQLEHVRFEGNSGENILTAENVGQLHWSHVSFNNNGESLIAQSVQTLVLSNFLNDENIYMTGVHISREVLKCSDVSKLLDVYNFTLLNTTFAYSYCSSELRLLGNSSIVTST